MSKRETARERDRRIIAEAAPWDLDRSGPRWATRFPIMTPTGIVQPEEWMDAVKAAARELNRIAKECRARK